MRSIGQDNVEKLVLFDDIVKFSFIRNIILNSFSRGVNG